jgi:hypothetical protein
MPATDYGTPVSDSALHANCNLFPVLFLKKIGTEPAERRYFVGQHLRN